MRLCGAGDGLSPRASGERDPSCRSISASDGGTQIKRTPELFTFTGEPIPGGIKYTWWTVELILQRGGNLETAGFTNVLPDSPAERRFIEDRIVGVFAGGVAQTRKFPGRRLDDGDARDECQAKKYADYLYCDQETERVRLASLENGRIRTVALVEKYWSSIEAIAQALIKHKTLDSEQLLALWVASSQECG